MRPDSPTPAASLTAADGTGATATKYVIVGVIGYVVNIVVFWACIHLLDMPEYWALVPAFVLNTASNFLLNRRWTFTPTSRRVRADLARFMVVVAACLITNYATFYLFFSILGLPDVLAQACSITLGIPVGYLGNRHWTFRGSSDAVLDTP